MVKCPECGKAQVRGKYLECSYCGYCGTSKRNMVAWDYDLDDYMVPLELDGSKCALYLPLKHHKVSRVRFGKGWYLMVMRR